MAASGYTPILLYASGTATNVPLAANLTSSASGAELAINYADGKLFYKDSSGVVQVLASKAGNVNVASFSAGTTGFTPSTATTGAITLAGTLATTNGGTGLTSFTANQVFYASSTSAFAQSSNLQFSGTDLTVYGITVGRGAGAVSTNTAVGASALAANTTGASNTSLGYQAGYSNTTGISNVFIGDGAGYSNTTANSNTFIGSGVFGFFYPAGYYNTTGTQNTYIGGGGIMTTGSKNTILGLYNGNQGGLDIRTASNYIVLSDGDGNPTLVSTGAGSISANNPTLGLNSELCLMRASVKRYFIWNDGSTNNLNVTPASFSSGVTLGPTATAWSAYSDRRIKSNIVDIEYGLSTIMAMQPRRYTVIANGVNSIGFIAQELKTVLPEAVVGEEIPFDDADTPQERSSKTMGIAKDHIIPVLVKAIQELKAEVDSLKAQINGASA